MAILQMAKVMIVSHRTEATELLEALQREGICQILNAEEATVSKSWPELAKVAERPREAEDLLGRLGRSIAFLKNYSKDGKGLAGILAPRTVIDRDWYQRVVTDEEILKVVDECEETEKTIERVLGECERIEATLEELGPWAGLDTPVEEIGEFRQAVSFAGLLQAQGFEETREEIGELGAAVEVVGEANNKYACIIVCLKENLGDVQKALRAAEFEVVSFEGPRLGAEGEAGAAERMSGTAAELIEQYTEELSERRKILEKEREKAGELSKEMLSLQILFDHYQNLFSREKARGSAPATEQTVILEGWVKEKDYGRLEKTVAGFGASTLIRLEPAEDEEMPVEIENRNYIRPFEVITRLYGMPKHFEVDPTVFLAPFFALFFALCLTDAGYGLIIIALTVLFIKKMQGDKKLIWMLGICSVLTVGAGALTGGWFGDAIQKLDIGWLNAARNKMMWFDPFEKPMIFFGLSLALGYIHVLTGLMIAFVHNLKQKNYIAGVCDQLTWLVMLNSIVILGASKFGVVPPQIGSFFGKLALVPAGAIFLFSHREGSWGGRIGMGAYNLFSAIFYMGDVLSYLRLMALGMVTAGLAMAINVIAQIAIDIPYIGFIIMIVILIGGHGFNLALSALSAFVHTLRLQYVEFFPKFLVGGGRSFTPLSKEYKHIYMK